MTKHNLFIVALCFLAGFLGCKMGNQPFSPSEKATAKPGNKTTAKTESFDTIKANSFEVITQNGNLIILNENGLFIEDATAHHRLEVDQHKVMLINDDEDDGGKYATTLTPQMLAIRETESPFRGITLGRSDYDLGSYGKVTTDITRIILMGGEIPYVRNLPTENISLIDMKNAIE